MNVAVRYYSRSGHVKLMAEALARGAGVEALSIEDPKAQLTEPVDILFIGGALYNFQLAQELKDYIDNLPEGIVADRAICFGSSWLTRRPVYLIQERLKNRGFTVAPQAVYARNNPRKLILESAEVFAEMEVQRELGSDAARPKPYVYFTKAEERVEAAEAEAEADDEDVELEVEELVAEVEEAAATEAEGGVEDLTEEA